MTLLCCKILAFKTMQYMSFQDITMLPGPSEVNTRIYSPEHESLYSLRPLG